MGEALSFDIRNPLRTISHHGGISIITCILPQIYPRDTPQFLGYQLDSPEGRTITFRWVITPFFFFLESPHAVWKNSVILQLFFS